MTVPTKPPMERTCHCCEMKQLSIVYQFHICGEGERDQFLLDDETR